MSDLPLKILKIEFKWYYVYLCLIVSYHRDATEITKDLPSKKQKSIKPKLNNFNQKFPFKYVFFKRKPHHPFFFQFWPPPDIPPGHTLAHFSSLMNAARAPSHSPRAHAYSSALAHTTFLSVSIADHEKP